MARNFVAASSQKIVLTPATASTIINRTAVSLTAWFRYSNAGTTRLSIYTEDGAGGSVTTMHLSMNDTVNGRIRMVRRDQSSNLVDMTYDGNFDDGNWHCVTYSATSKSAHALYIDGVSRATSSTNLSGTFDTVTSQAIGMRKPSGGAEASFFDGDIADVALHAVALSLAEHTTLYDKSKHLFNANATEPISYWPLMNVGTDVRNVVAARLNDTAAAVTGATAVDGPDGAGPTGMTESCDIGTIRVLAVPTTTLITGSSTSTDTNYLLREQGNTVHTPNDTGKEYKMYTGGSPSAYTGGNVSIHLYYTSNPNSTWTYYGEVITAATLPMEDPYVVIDPDTGTYHLWAENKTGATNQSGIAHFTSADGLTWSSEDNTVLDSGTAGEWDDDDVSSPIVWVEGTPGSRTWYMLYEGRKIAGQRGEMGLATNTSPNGNFTKYGSNPVMAGRAGNIDDGSLVCDDLVKIGSTYWVISHCHDGDDLWTIARASSTDLHTWTRAANAPLTVKDVTPSAMFMGGTNFGKIMAYIDTTPVPFKLFRGFGETATQTDEWPAVIAAASGQRGLMMMGIGA